MRVRFVAVSITAVAVMSVFGSAFAQSPSTPSGGVNVNPNVGVDANVGISNTDVNAGANISPGINIGTGDQNTSSSVSANQSATTTNPSSSNLQSSAAGGSSASSGASSSDDRDRFQGSNRGDEGKKRGLDRADQAAGEHGKQGRDNARHKQGSD